MDLLIAFLIFAAVMVVCLIWSADFSMLVALSVGLVCFYTVARLRGFAPGDLLRMCFKGIKRSMIVVRIFVLIGILTALWRSGGVITFFVYHGVRIIPPQLFLVAGFGLTCLLGYALGTSFGITGTVGVILITLARSGGVPPALMAGAILSGAYFGDRTAPASSCANLVATVTETKLYDNISRMLKSGLVPLLVTAVIYAVLSPRYPLVAGEGGLLTLLEQNYNLSLLCAVPAVIMLVLPVCKVNVRLSMMLSSAAAFLLSVLLQDLSLRQTLMTCLSGYQAQEPVLADILSGGGLLSMVNVSGIIILSSTYSGIFEGTQMLEDLQEKLMLWSEKITCCGVLTAASAFITCVFCNQTIGTMMIQQLMGPVYERMGKTREELSLDMSNTLVVMVALCPWCIACAVPLSMLGVGIEAIPLALFLWMLPLWWVVVRLWQDKRSL